MALPLWFGKLSRSDDAGGRSHDGRRLRRVHKRAVDVGQVSSEPGAAREPIVVRVRLGDAAAFEELFRTYVAAMLRFARSFVRDADVAEDVVQEVFGRVWLHHATWDPASDVLSYLLAAVRNRALNTVTTDARRSGVTRRYFGPNEAPATGSVALPADDRLEHQEQRDALWGVIHTLPEKRRTVLLLRWRHGLDWDAIARIMGTSVAAVRMTHSRAIQMLRELLPDVLA